MIELLGVATIMMCPMIFGAIAIIYSVKAIEDE